MTRFLKTLEARMKEPELNLNFSKTVQPNKKLIKKNEAAYNTAKENFCLAQDK
ncbi:hypothetical protein [Lysinibacillus fusiformis]|uniref:hypothetical protein n=1 Tax=Lysinibacillus fusiformis TaxID=28031 RepID=UPI001596BA57|nr:hypothetical protein [Lysinibacillus fusiformis]